MSGGHWPRTFSSTGRSIVGIKWRQHVAVSYPPRFDEDSIVKHREDVEARAAMPSSSCDLAWRAAYKRGSEQEQDTTGVNLTHISGINCRSGHIRRGYSLIFAKLCERQKKGAIIPAVKGPSSPLLD
jgi:hypothetical protein